VLAVVWISALGAAVQSPRRDRAEAAALAAADAARGDRAPTGW